MISSTLATLECTAQVTTAPITMQSTGSPVMAFMNTRMPGAFSAGASVSIRICSASSIRPRPMKTRPTSLIRERAPTRKATRPMRNRTGASGGDVERQDLHDQRGADIGAEHDRERRDQADQALGGEGTGDQGGRGAALQQRGEADARRKGGEAVAQGLCRAAGADRGRRRAESRCGPCAGPTAAAPRRPSGREVPRFP